MQKKVKRVVISVVSDLVTDQRVHRTAMCLQEEGWDVFLIGRRKKDSLPLPDRGYTTRRFRLYFEKGPLFYFSYNLRLFFWLLFHRTDLLIANDLDTLPANYWISRIKACKLIYDSHEYFTGVPELQSRPKVRAVWKFLERRFLPKVDAMYTVNASIAGLYAQEYKIHPQVIRNVPVLSQSTSLGFSRKEAGLPADKKILIFQGAGINIQRGAEEALEAMQYTEQMLLLFIGGGDVIDKLKREAITLHLEDKVKFLPKMPMDRLAQFTRLADAGLTLDKDTNINYRYSLPNKLFDYIHAGIPVLSSDLPEISRIVKTYELGLLLDSHDPKRIAEKMKELFSDSSRLKQWRDNAARAARELNWEVEKKKLIELIRHVTN